MPIQTIRERRGVEPKSEDYDTTLVHNGRCESGSSALAAGSSSLERFGGVLYRNEEPVPIMASNCAMIRSAFSDSVESLLTGLLEVFPECQATRTTVDAFHAFVKGNEHAEHSMITAFGECVKNGTRLVQGRDEEALFAAVEQIPVLKSIDIRSKWSDEGFDDASKETLWNYVKVLNAYAKVYTLVPDSIMSRVEEVLNGVGEGTGNFDMVKMVEQVTSSFGENPIDCGALSEDRVSETISALGDLISIQAPGLNVADLVGHFVTKPTGVPAPQQPQLADK